MGHYVSFLVFATLLAVAPGPDTLLTLRSTVVGGRTRGLWTMIGICVAGTVQGVLAATGLGAIIAAAEPVFETIRWAGVAYLVFLGITAIRAAMGSAGAAWVTGSGPSVRRRVALRQGFLCNITNPKVLAFNLAVLPQFVGSDAGIPTLLLYALTLTVVGAFVLLGVVFAAGAVRRAIQSRRVRRSIDGATGLVFVGFAAALAAEG